MYASRVRQLEIPWGKKPSVASTKTRGTPFLLNTTNQTFRLRASGPDDALEQAQTIARDRKSCTTVYEEVDGKCGPRIGAFNTKGERFL